MAQGKNKPEIDEMDQHAAAWVIHDHAVATTGKQSPSDAARQSGHASSREWIQSTPAHAEAYENAQSVWDDLALIDPEDLKQPGPAANDASTSPAKRSWHIVAIAATILLAVIGGIELPDLMARSFADHSSAHGEITTLTLADGSRVLLDSASAIDVAFSDTERAVTLISGRASFDVAPASDTVPPFVVHAGNSTTRALGTKFDVEFGDDDDGHDLTVTAIEHQIMVTPDVAQADTSLVLSPGERISIRAGASDIAVQQINLATSTSWQNGFLIFDHARLSDVTRTLNRYASGPILIASGDLANREVSGMFRIDKIDQAVNVISKGLGASSYSIPHVATFLVE